MVTYGNDADPHEPGARPPATAPRGRGPISMLEFTLAALEESDRQQATVPRAAPPADDHVDIPFGDRRSESEPAGFRVDESWLATIGPTGGVKNIDDAPRTSPIAIVAPHALRPPEPAGRHWQAAPTLDIGDAPRFAEAVPVVRRRSRRPGNDRLRALAAALIVCQLAIGVFLGIRPGSGPGTVAAGGTVPVPSLSGTPGDEAASPGADLAPPGSNQAAGAPPPAAPPLAILPIPVAVTATPTTPPAAQVAPAAPEDGQLAPPPGPPPGPPPSPERPPPPPAGNPPPPPPSPVPPPTPTPTPTATPPPPAKPVIVSQAAGSSSIQTRGCPSDTTSVRAVITSSVPLRAVTLEWVELASWQPHATPMTQIGDSWVGSIGPSAAPGTIAWRVQARDSQGGTASGSAQSVQVTAC